LPAGAVRLSGEVRKPHRAVVAVADEGVGDAIRVVGDQRRSRRANAARSLPTAGVLKVPLAAVPVRLTLTSVVAPGSSGAAAEGYDGGKCASAAALIYENGNVYAWLNGGVLWA
jgi:hypothetical protein